MFESPTPPPPDLKQFSIPKPPQDIDRIDEIFATRKNFVSHTPEMPPVLKGGMVKEEDIFSTQSKDAYKTACRKVSSLLNQLVESDVHIPSINLWVFDNRKKEPIEDHEVKHYFAILELLKDEQFMRIYRRISQEEANPRLEIKLTWSVDQNNIVPFIQGIVTGFDNIDLIEYAKYKFTDAKEAMIFIRGMEKVAMAPQYPSEGDYKNIISKAEMTKYMLDELPGVEPSDIGEITTIITKLRERNRRQTQEAYLEQIRELEEIQQGGGEDSLTRYHFSHQIKIGGFKWIEKQLQTNRKLLELMPQASAYTIFDPQQAYEDHQSLYY